MTKESLPFIHPDDMPDFYALTGVGTCMEPELNDGSAIAFTKKGTPQPGDLVGVVFTKAAARRWNQPGIVKRLVSSIPHAGFAGIVVVEQHNPPRRYLIPTDDILAVQKCLGMAERHGKEVRIRRALMEA